MADHDDKALTAADWRDIARACMDAAERAHQGEWADRCVALARRASLREARAREGIVIP